MKFWISLAAALYLLAPAAALADYKSEYKAYMAAFEAGDVAKALEHGEKAWRQAEAELGDHVTTAILAYNYAVLVVRISPAKAVAAFDRALAIATKERGALSVDDILLRRAEARLLAEPTKGALEKELETLLNAASPDNATTGEAQALGWATLAGLALKSEEYRRAAKAADNAIRFASLSDPSDRTLLREALYVAAVSRVARNEPSDEEILEAVALFDRAIPLFPAQKDIDTFDRLLAATLAWTRTLDELVSAHGSAKLKAAYARSVFSGRDRSYRWQQTRPFACDDMTIYRQLEITKPSYPPTARHRGYVGSTVIGYDLNESGVARTIVLADFSGTNFGRAVTDAMKRWRVKSNIDPVCWKNHVLIVNFRLI